MYGRGAQKKIEEAFAYYGPATFSKPLEQPDGSLLFDEISWANGSAASIQCWPDRVHWGALRSTSKGLYTHLAKHTVKAFRDLGVKTYTASPTDEQAEKVLKKRLDWQPHPDRPSYLVLEL